MAGILLAATITLVVATCVLIEFWEQIDVHKLCDSGGVACCETGATECRLLERSINLLASIDKNMSEVRKWAAGPVTNPAELRNVLMAIKGDVSSLASSVSTIKENSTELKTGLVGIKASVDTVDSDTAAIWQSLYGLAKDVAVIRENAYDIQKSLGKVSTDAARNVVVVVNSDVTGSKFPTDRLEAETIYSIAGFERGKADINAHQKEWLHAFFHSMEKCISRTKPTIRLIGYASAEQIGAPKNGKNKQCNGGDGKSKPNSSSSSDLENCRLAIRRVAKVAGYLAKMDDDRTKASCQASSTKSNQIKEAILNGCGQQTHSLSSFHMVVERWCSPASMINSRLGAFLPERTQPHFLNRSVYIVVEDPGSCRRR